MKRLGLRITVGLVALLCATTIGAQTTVALAHIDSATWQTNLAVASSSIGATIRVTDCNYGVYGDTVTLPYNGAALVEHLGSMLCSQPALGVVRLPVTGTLRAWSEATYRDGLGNFNTVAIPPLPEPITPAVTFAGGGFTANSYRLEGIENGVGGKATFLALIAEGGGYARARIDVLGAGGEVVANEWVDVEGFAFYELRTVVAIGSVTIVSVPPNYGPAPLIAPLYAIGFVGYRIGGSPRVEIPRRFTSVAIP